MGTTLYFYKLRGPLRPSPRTPWESMDPQLRIFGLVGCENANNVKELNNLKWKFNYIYNVYNNDQKILVHC